MRTSPPLVDVGVVEDTGDDSDERLLTPRREEGDELVVTVGRSVGRLVNQSIDQKIESLAAIIVIPPPTHPPTQDVPSFTFDTTLGEEHEREEQANLLFTLPRTRVHPTVTTNNASDFSFTLPRRVPFTVTTNLPLTQTGRVPPTVTTNNKEADPPEMEEDDEETQLDDWQVQVRSSARDMQEEAFGTDDSDPTIIYGTPI